MHLAGVEVLESSSYALQAYAKPSQLNPDGTGSETRTLQTRVLETHVRPAHPAFGGETAIRTQMTCYGRDSLATSWFTVHPPLLIAYDRARREQSHAKCFLVFERFSFQSA